MFAQKCIQAFVPVTLAMAEYTALECIDPVLFPQTTKIAEKVETYLLQIIGKV